MAQKRCFSVRLIETVFSRRPPVMGHGLLRFQRVSRGAGAVRPAGRRRTPGDGRGRSLRSGDHVVVVGGGIAGSAFARQLLRLTAGGPDVRVTVISSTSCNYCGGLLTHLSMQTLDRIYDYRVPEPLILGDIHECIYVNQAGAVGVSVVRPLVTMLRTDKFGYPGFDDYFRERILEGLAGDRLHERLEVIEPATVTGILLPEHRNGRRAVVRYHRYRPDVGFVSNEVEADFVVIASGLRSLRSNMMREFCRVTGFQAPPLMAASVTEVDATGAARNDLAGRMLILDNIVPDCVAAIIHKREDWLTVTSLHRPLRRDDLEVIFRHPAVRRYIHVTDVTERLRCRSICSATVYTAAARRFYGDGWVVIGDLTGHGRVLKDGYFAAFLGAHLAAWTMVNVGTSSSAFARCYHRPLLHFLGDNRVGMTLFHLNRRLAPGRWFHPWLLDAAVTEQNRCAHGGPVHAAIRALATGELSYRVIAFLLLWGLVGYVLRAPMRFWRSLRSRPEGTEGRKVAGMP